MINSTSTDDTLIGADNIGSKVIPLWSVVSAKINRLSKTKYTHPHDYANGNKKLLIYNGN